MIARMVEEEALIATAAAAVMGCKRRAASEGSEWSNHTLGTRFGGRLATQSGPSAVPAAMPAHAPKPTLDLSVACDPPGSQHALDCL